MNDLLCLLYLMTDVGPTGKLQAWIITCYWIGASVVPKGLELCKLHDIAWWLLLRVSSSSDARMHTIKTWQGSYFLFWNFCVSLCDTAICDLWIIYQFWTVNRLGNASMKTNKSVGLVQQCTIAFGCCWLLRVPPCSYRHRTESIALIMNDRKVFVCSVKNEENPTSQDESNFHWQEEAAAHC